MSNFQPGILTPPPGHARHMQFSLAADTNPREALKSLSKLADGTTTYSWDADTSVEVEANFEADETGMDSSFTVETSAPEEYEEETPAVAPSPPPPSPATMISYAWRLATIE